jgi:hypothetical protein
VHVEEAIVGVELIGDPMQDIGRIDPEAREIVPQTEPEDAVLETGGHRMRQEPAQGHALAERLTPVPQAGSYDEGLARDCRLEEVGKGLRRMGAVASHQNDEVEAVSQRVLEGGLSSAAVAQVTGLAVEAEGEGIVPRVLPTVTEFRARLHHHHHLFEDRRDGLGDTPQCRGEGPAIQTVEEKEGDAGRSAAHSTIIDQIRV